MKPKVVALLSGVFGGLAVAVPWPALLGLAALVAVVYLCRLRVVGDIGRRAIDRSDPEGVPKIVSSIVDGS